MAKVHRDTERGYRQRMRPREGEVGFQVVVAQSDLWIVARPLPGCDAALQRLAADVLHAVRAPLAAYIEIDPVFLATLAPHQVPPGAPEIVRDMAASAAVCGVGPMAAVAGAVAQRVAEGLAPYCSDVLVENGGDLFLRSSRERLVGLLADPEAGATLGLRLGPEDFPLSLCASSATIGHSLSLGQGELVVVRSRSGSFADAAATALCNLLKAKADLPRVTQTAQRLSRGVPPNRVDGVFAQCHGQIAVWGEMELAAL